MSPDFSSQTVQRLEQHPESIRIKKLIFSICKQYWENDLTFINRFPLSDLLPDLMELKPTLGELVASLNAVVKSLNRSQIYVPIAQLIIQEIAILYSDNQNNLSQLVSTLGAPDQNADPPPLRTILEPIDQIDQVVATLYHHSEEFRIKKLLFSLYKHRWENDLKPLTSQEFRSLILNIQQNYATPQALSLALSKIVETINKPVLYRSLANTIIAAFAPLYQNAPLPSKKAKATLPPKQSQQSFETRFIAQPPMPSPPSVSQPSPQSHGTTPIDFSRSTEIHFSTQIKTGTEDTIAIAKTQLSTTYDLFEIRQMVMQYTNPLRAKILLFSVVIAPWDANYPDWSRLRSHTLETLIDKLILTGMTMPEIETKLQAAAYTCPETDEFLQAASSLIDAIYPFVSKPRKLE